MSAFSYLFLLTLIIACSDNDVDPTPAPPEDTTTTPPPAMAELPAKDFVLLTDMNTLLWVQEGNLNSAETREITGLADGETLLSIDFRPATGQLYGVSSMSQLYSIDENTGMAIKIGEPFTPAIEGEQVSLDFNPTVDRIRLVTETGQNLRLHPELGSVVEVDGELNGEGNPMIQAAAYTNSMVGAESTTLYDVDIMSGTLYRQDPPNDGTLVAIGELGAMAEGVASMDISADNEAALLVISSDSTRMHLINLESGAATMVSGSVDMAVRGVAFRTNPVAYSASKDGMLHRFNFRTGDDMPVQLQGLTDDEYIGGLDFRPANSQLYAMTNTGRLLTVNTADGSTTEVGTLAVEGSTFGFDFNPTVDRIRIVSDEGQNLRVHPDEGTIVETDGMLNPGEPHVDAAAYTNNNAMAETTLLYVIDSESGMLYTQNPPNDGTLVEVGMLDIDISEHNGFDIGMMNMAYGVFNTADNMMGVYEVNLDDASTTAISTIGWEGTAFTIGLGF